MDVTAELSARLASPAEDADGLVGVEHEFVVGDELGPVDFRTLIAGLDLGGRRLDPGDPLAVRGRWGGVITADGAEAEIATPPVTVRPGYSDELAAWAAIGTARLRASIPDLGVEGYSTHLSVKDDDRQVVRTAHRFTRHFALPQMLLFDRVESPGLLVRPRRGRLELCGDYVAGSQLRAASVFAVAGTVASRRRSNLKLPPELRPRIESARGRYGFYVDRCAFGPDLYRHGRRTILRPGLTAQDVLSRTWEAVRPVALRTARVDEVRLVDDLVDGRAPLPIEEVAADDVIVTGDRPAPTGRVVETRTRPGMRVEAIVATWGGTAFEVASDAGAIAVLTIPLRLLDGFLVALDHGRLDDVLAGALHAAPALPRLMVADQLDGVGVFGGIGAVQYLVPGERDPLTGRLAGAGRGARGSRENKERSHDAPKGRSISKALVAGAIVLGLLALVAALAFAGGGDNDDEQIVAGPGPDPTTTLAAAVPTTAATLAATEFDGAVWRGWIGLESDDEEVPGSRFYVRTWWVDPSRTSFDVVWREDLYRHFFSGNGVDPACQQSEGVGSVTDGTGTSQVIPTSQLNPEVMYADGPGLIFNGFAFKPDIFLDGIVRFCSGLEQTGNQGGFNGLLQGLRVGAPLDIEAVPETVSFRRSFLANVTETDRRTVQVCMTRSNVDTDGDDLPDAVDLAPSSAAPLTDLGIPGGPPGTPIPSRVAGGVEGVEGLPLCPTAGATTEPAAPDVTPGSPDASPGGA